MKKKPNSLQFDGVTCLDVVENKVKLKMWGMEAQVGVGEAII